MNAAIFIALACVGFVLLEWAYVGHEAIHGVPVLKRSATLGWDSVEPREVLVPVKGGKAVYFLGDSFTFNMHWPRAATNILRGALPDIDAYNLAVPGYGTFQSYLKLKENGDPKAALIVLLFFAWNDFRDNFPFPAIYYNVQSRARPYVERPIDSFRLPELIENSKIFERVVLNRLQPAFDTLKHEHGVDWFAENRVYDLTMYDDLETWHPFYDDSAQESPYVAGAWKSTERALKLLKDFADRKGARLLVVGIDNALTVDGDVYEQWVVEKGIADHFNSELPLYRLGRVLKEVGVQYVNVLPALRAIGATKKVYTGAPGHVGNYLGEEGEDVLAKAVAEAALPLLQTDGR